MNKHAVSLIITVLNERSTIDSLIGAIKAQTVLPHETLIVDGGSSDGTYEYLQAIESSARSIGLRVIQVVGNRSLSRNAGIVQAKHSLIAITDAGCIPHSSWIEELRAKIIEAELTNAKNAQYVIAGYYDASPKTHFEEAVVPYALVMPDKVNPTTFLPATRSMLMTKQVWQDLHGFDETLSDNEDYDFARRLKSLIQERNHSTFEPPIHLLFTDKAKVTWQPRSTLSSFAWMIYRFARGDAQAGLWRPKVGLIFARYVLVGVVSSLLILTSNWLLLAIFLLVSTSIYVLWSILKNLRYVPHGWYWLPILQVTSDFQVMRGSIAGSLKQAA